jgi:acrylyl-CoA reductase (NADPH)
MQDGTLTTGDFQALVIDERNGKCMAAVRRMSERELPLGDVTVSVKYSSLNYKDGMVITGAGGLVRRFPHISGGDLAAVVESSTSPLYKPGDKVVLVSSRVGERYWGGHAEKARVPGDLLVPLPPGLSLEQAMAIGTAGFTAMLCIGDLERHGLKPGDGEVLVTGAAGGVGSTAIAILTKLGYDVAASTGRKETHEYLRFLGARTIVDRATLETPPDRPLLEERWAGCIDSVGGQTLATVLAMMKYGTSVSACGIAGGTQMNLSVFPFILRSVNLLGMDTISRALPEKSAAWQRMARDFPLEKLDAITTLVRLDQVPEYARRILKGQVRGRIVVDVAAERRLAASPI